MSVTSDIKRRHLRHFFWNLPQKAAPPPRRWPWYRLVAVALLAGYFLFCHGCHGDEDNEILSTFIPWAV